MNLAQAVQALVDKHGGVRALSRVSGLAPSYISRMASGKTTPFLNKGTLTLLGLESEVTYRVIEKPEPMTKANADAYHGGEDDGL